VGAGGVEHAHRRSPAHEREQADGTGQPQQERVTEAPQQPGARADRPPRGQQCEENSVQSPERDATGERGESYSPGHRPTQQSEEETGDQTGGA
jgi:hypothetical protein